MVAGEADELLRYPIPNDAALTPPGEWAELRDKCPLAHVRFPSGDQATLLTRYDDVRKVLVRPAVRAPDRRPRTPLSCPTRAACSTASMAMEHPPDRRGSPAVAADAQQVVHRQAHGRRCDRRSR